MEPCFSKFNVYQHINVTMSIIQSSKYFSVYQTLETRLMDQDLHGNRHPYFMDIHLQIWRNKERWTRWNFPHAVLNGLF